MRYQWISKGVSVRRIVDQRVVLNAPGNPDWEAFEDYVAKGGIVGSQVAGGKNYADANQMPIEIRAVLRTVAQLTNTPMSEVRNIFKSEFAKVRDV